MERELSPTRAWGALLVVWLGCALTAATFYEHGETRVLLAALAAVVGAGGLWQPWHYTGSVAGLLATVAYLIVRVLIDGSGDLAVAAVIVTLTLVGAGVLVDSLASQIASDDRRRREDARLIEELTPTYGDVGVLKWSHALQALSDEIKGARRYKYPVSLALLGVNDWAAAHERWGPREGPKLADAVGRALRGVVRSTDAVVYRGNEQFVLVLPHIPLSGALVVMDKCRVQLKAELGLEMRAGIAEFPTDGATTDELVLEADAALEFARASMLGVASRTLLGVG